MATRATNLCLVLGDQLTQDLASLKAIGANDPVLMLEVAREATHVPSHAQRTVLFLSAMRHFAAELKAAGRVVDYVSLDDPENTHTFEGEIERAIRRHRSTRLVFTRPGEHRVLAEITRAAAHAGCNAEMLEDNHFLTTPAQFAAWAKGRKSLTMEYFYREQRRRLGYLMEGDGPLGGEWNYDKDNRQTFGKTGPSPKPSRPPQSPPDAITQEVMHTVARRFPNAPGSVNAFAWPVTRNAALAALRQFIDTRLADFGPYEDAMWQGEPFLYHSTLSPLLNLHLLSPQECCDAAIRAFQQGKAPLASIEGFVRQLIGWREFVRGVYWLEGPDYERRNFLGETGTLPEFYWTGDTDMNCLKTCIGEVREHAYGHHIQRLMVTGNFALLAGVHPKHVSDWYLGMYADGVDWVTLPNALGMVMHADGVRDEQGRVVRLPVVGTKPYAAGGAYINKMSNYCRGCRYDPAKRVGDDACPFTTMYWDFMRRHRNYLSKNTRTAAILGTLDRFGPAHVQQIAARANSLRQTWGVLPPATRGNMDNDTGETTRPERRETKTRRKDSSP
ncbi:MAG: cryptochrome/photolyase family protein [Phycisphaerales bacterium]